LLSRSSRRGSLQDHRQIGYLVTEVQDWGHGIEQKDIPKMFSMFNDEFEETNKTSGVGLGLSTARILTHALQGAISLESVKDDGTKVTFSVITKP